MGCWCIRLGCTTIGRQTGCHLFRAVYESRCVYAGRVVRVHDASMGGNSVAAACQCLCSWAGRLIISGALGVMVFGRSVWSAPLFLPADVAAHAEGRQVATAKCTRGTPVGGREVIRIASAVMSSRSATESSRVVIGCIIVMRIGTAYCMLVYCILVRGTGCRWRWPATVDSSLCAWRRDRYASRRD